ncbi:MAG: hypothetical protein M0D55_01080 [Elusimicrobiota bacterium]|nr:MAG: hypothetical protein M0D55_01080 [Elusimicrobiota bacterium]
MRFERIRWLLLPVAAIAGALAFYRATPARLATACVCGLAWYGLSRGKIHSLDRERFMGGKLGAALRYWKKRSSAANL